MMQLGLNMPLQLAPKQSFVTGSAGSKLDLSTLQVKNPLTAAQKTQYIVIGTGVALVAGMAAIILTRRKSELEFA